MHIYLTHWVGFGWLPWGHLYERKGGEDREKAESWQRFTVLCESGEGSCLADADRARCHQL